MLGRQYTGVECIAWAKAGYLEIFFAELVVEIVDLDLGSARVAAVALVSKDTKHTRGCVQEAGGPGGTDYDEGPGERRRFGRLSWAGEEREWSVRARGQVRAKRDMWWSVPWALSSNLS